MTPEYTAGFIDGEGCVRIAHMRPGGYAATVQVSNTRRSALDELQKTYGGFVGIQKRSLHESGRWAPPWHYGVNGTLAMRMLRAIEPFLRIKKTQAQVVLGVERFNNPERRYKRWEPQELAEVHDAMDVIKELNARGDKQRLGFI